MPHVLGAQGDIVAVLWSWPAVLHSPPLATTSNKILWVSRVTVTVPSVLDITAQRMAGLSRVGAPEARQVPGGPGPSIINMPSPGCWRFTLRWSVHVDSLDLQYSSRALQ